MQFPREKPLSNKAIKTCVEEVIDGFLVPKLISKGEEVHQSDYVRKVLVKSRPEFYLHFDDPDRIIRDMMSRAVKMTKENIFGDYFHHLVEALLQARFPTFVKLDGIDCGFYDQESVTFYLVESKSSPDACNGTMVDGIGYRMKKAHEWILEAAAKRSPLKRSAYTGVRVHDYGRRMYEQRFHDSQFMNYTVLQGQVSLLFCTGRNDAYVTRMKTECGQSYLKQALRLFDDFESDSTFYSNVSDFNEWNTTVRGYTGSTYE